MIKEKTRVQVEEHVIGSPSGKKITFRCNFLGGENYLVSRDD